MKNESSVFGMDRALFHIYHLTSGDNGHIVTLALDVAFAQRNGIKAGHLAFHGWAQRSKSNCDGRCSNAPAQPSG